MDSHNCPLVKVQVAQAMCLGLYPLDHVPLAMLLPFANISDSFLPPYLPPLLAVSEPEIKKMCTALVQLYLAHSKA